jgi:hypothetical protein
VALEDRVLLLVKDAVEVSAGGARVSDVALAADAQLDSFFDPLGDVEVDLLLGLDLACATTGFAGVLNNLSLSTASAARGVHREEALAAADLSCAATGLACDGFGAALCSGPSAALALLKALQEDALLGARVNLVEG